MIVLDNGALIALERDDRAMWARLKAAALSRTRVVVPAGALGQAWRGGGGRQAQLARALEKCRILPLDEAAAKAAGILCGISRTRDLIDASVAVAAAHADVTAVCTSDPGDIGPLVRALGGTATIVRC